MGRIDRVASGRRVAPYLAVCRASRTETLVSAARMSLSISVRNASSSASDMVSYVGGSESVNEGLRRWAYWSSIYIIIFE